MHSDAAPHFRVEHIHDADEPGHEFIGRLLVNFPWRADLFEVSAGENHDAATVEGRLDHVLNSHR